MCFPKRKNIRLQEYDYSQNGAYYVTICTHNRANLFYNAVGANLCVRPNNPHLLVENSLLELENKYCNVKIDKYIIMPNHIHFILIIENTTGEHTGSPLHEMIQWFKTQSTNAYIKGVKDNLFPPFDKHVWQRNYYDHVIRTEQDYLDIWQYIDTNPQKWADDPYHINMGAKLNGN